MNQVEDTSGISYLLYVYENGTKEQYINIPYSTETNLDQLEDISCSDFPLFELGEHCKECQRKREVEHDCIYKQSPGHPLRIYVREKCVRMFENIKLGYNCEKGVYNYTIKTCKYHNWSCSWRNKMFKNIYKQTFMKVNFNIHNPETAKLKRKILKGTLLPQALPFMTPRELHPKLWQPYGLPGDKVIIIRPDAIIGESLLTCVKSKCRSKKVHYYEIQTRSADEPMTAYCTCLECGYKWTM